MSDFTAIAQEMTRRLFGDHVAPPAAVGDGDMPDGLWPKIEEMGLNLALVPEDAGGSGLSFSDVLPILQDIGRFAVGAPLAETMVAALLLANAGIAIPSGPLGIGPANERETAELRRKGEGWHIEASLTRVPLTGTTRAIALECTCEGRTYIALVELGRCERKSGSNLAGQSRDDLIIDLPLAPGAAAPLPPGPGVLLLGAALRSAQIAGALDAVVAQSVAYAQERVQFGRPIAKFQAVQHLLAILAGHAAVALAAADLAAEAIDGSGDRFDVAIAKSAASDAAGKGAAIAHQVHGAIGVSHEHKLHRSTLRLLGWREEFGSEATWQSEIGRAAFATGGGSALWERLAS